MLQHLYFSFREYCSEYHFVFFMSCCATLHGMSWNQHKNTNYIISAPHRPYVFASLQQKSHEFIWGLNVESTKSDSGHAAVSASVGGCFDTFLRLVRIVTGACSCRSTADTDAVDCRHWTTLRHVVTFPHQPSKHRLSIIITIITRTYSEN